MSDAPSFFVPAVEDDESVYTSMAESAERPAPEPGKRIYSITFMHNGTEWTATVGEQLHGVKLDKQGSKKGKKVSDPATVLAIFPGAPYKVVIDHGLVGDVGSEWHNPFLAGEPESITYFSHEANSQQ